MGLLDTLLVYWKLREGPGIDRYDATCGGKDLVEDRSLTVGHRKGLLGYAADFDTTAELLREGDTDLGIGDNDFTLALWFQADSHTNTPRLAGFWDSLVYGYNLLFNWTDHKIGCQYTSNGADIINLAGPVATDGVPYFVVFWHDAVANTVNLQVNNGTIYSQALAGGIYTADLPFRIGGYSPAEPGYNILNGWISDVGIWKSAPGGGGVLTADQRAALYNDGFGLSYPFGEHVDGCCPGVLRTLSAEMTTHLAGESLTIAVCVKVERTDGTILGFTTHDRDLTFSGTTYEALSAVEATALRQELGTGIDNLDVFGLLQSDAVAETDLLAGRYDGADITLMLVNWDSLSDGAVTLLKGTLGEITIQDGKYTAEVRSQMQRLAQQIGDLTSPTCRVKALGDSQCAPGGLFADAKDITDYQFARTVTDVDSDRQFTFGASAEASGYFDYGKVTFTSGLNNGLSREIKVHTLVGGEALLKMQEAFPFTVQVGDTATLEAGCNRTFDICKSRFANVINMRAEPYVPGTDKLIRRGRPPSG